MMGRQDAVEVLDYDISMVGKWQNLGLCNLKNQFDGI